MKKLPFEFKVITKEKDRHLVVFPNDPSVIWVKEPMLDVLSLANRLSKPEIINALSAKYKKDLLIDVYKDLGFLKKTGFLKYRDKKPWAASCYPRNIRPHLICLHLTHRCNLNCRYCYSLDFRREYNKLRNVDMNWPTAKRIIDWTFKVNRNSPSAYINFTFFGGEPLLNVKIMERSLEYIKKRWEKNRAKAVKFAICTNGTLIDKKVARILKRYNVVTIITMHNKNRGLFKNVMNKKIRILKKFVPKRNIIINYIISEKKDIRDIEFLARRIKGIAQRFSFNLELKNQGLQEVLEETKRFTKRLTKNKTEKHSLPPVFYGNLEEIGMLVSGKKELDNCGAIQSGLSFLPDGTMHPCSGPRGNRIFCSLGNINGAGLDEDLYANDTKVAKLKDRRKTDCMKCWARSYCKGMCKYSRKLKPSIVEGKNLLCDANRFFKGHLIKWYSGLSDKGTLDILTKRTNRNSIDIAKENEGYEKIKLILRFRYLINKKLRYARLVTPCVYKG